MNALSYLQQCGSIMQGVVLDSIRSIQYWQPPQSALEPPSETFREYTRIQLNTQEYARILRARKNTKEHARKHKNTQNAFKNTWETSISANLSRQGFQCKIYFFVFKAGFISFVVRENSKSDWQIQANKLFRLLKRKHKTTMQTWNLSLPSCKFFFQLCKFCPENSLM